jgi:RHS repeat-associated protein
VQNVNSGATFDSFYDISGNLDAMWSTIPGYNGWKAQWAYLGNQRLALYASGTVFYPMMDHLGSERIVTDSSGNVAQCTDYYPFGEEMTCPSNDTVGDIFYFTGQQHDFESHLDYFMARHYSSAQGRFMQPDPSGLFFADPTDPQQLNLYGYVRNNPLSMIDPSGLQDDVPQPCDTSGCIVTVTDPDSCYGSCLWLYEFDLGGEGGGLANTGGIFGNPCQFAPGTPRLRRRQPLRVRAHEPMCDNRLWRPSHRRPKHPAELAPIAANVTNSEE